MSYIVHAQTQIVCNNQNDCLEPTIGNVYSYLLSSKSGYQTGCTFTWSITTAFDNTTLSSAGQFVNADGSAIPNVSNVYTFTEPKYVYIKWKVGFTSANITLKVENCSNNVNANGFFQFPIKIKYVDKPTFINSNPLFVPCTQTSTFVNITQPTTATSYEWTLPTGWYVQGNPSQSGTFITTDFSLNIIPTQSNSTSEIKVRALNNKFTTPPNTIYSDYATLPITRTASTLQVLANSIINLVINCGDIQPIVIKTTFINTASYTWTIPNGWRDSNNQTGTFTTNSNTINLIPNGLNGGVTKVVVNYSCLGQSSSLSGTVSVGYNQGSPPVVGNAQVSGPGVLCNPTATYTITNQPSGTVAIWSSNNINFPIDPITGVATRLNNFSGSVNVVASLSKSGFGSCGSSSLVPKTTLVGTASVNIIDAFYSVCSTAPSSGGNSVANITQKSTGIIIDGPVTNRPPTPQPGTEGCISIAAKVPPGYNITRLRWVFDNYPPIETDANSYYKYKVTCNGQRSVPLNVKVSALNECGWGTYSCISLITLDCSTQRATLSICGGGSSENATTPIIDNIIAEPTYLVSPNPASSQLNISTTESAQTPILSLSLYDKLGNRVLNQSNKSGLQQAQISTSSLPSGFYILHISDGIQTVKKLVLVDK
jgi:hypothetical protein